MQKTQRALGTRVLKLFSINNIIPISIIPYGIKYY
jgi:hypothetical protein